MITLKVGHTSQFATSCIIRFGKWGRGI